MTIKKRISSIFLKMYNVKVKEVVVNHHKYLGNRKNLLKIYGYPPRNMFFSPFNMTFDTIDRLLLIDFEDDPIYCGIELQIFRVVNEEYPLVFLYRKDDVVDIYYTNEAIINNRKKLIEDLLTNVSFSQLEKIEFQFRVDDMGLDAFLRLKDKLEKDIEFRIKENTPKRELTAMLAPVGAESKKPKYFPIIYLDKFGMIIKKDTEILVKTHGILRTPVEMPVRMNGMHIYLARYSLEPIISNWNNSYEGNLDPILIKITELIVKNKNLVYEIFNNEGYYEIKKISGKDAVGHTISFEFSPTIPNLICLKRNVNIKGKFSCCIDDREGIFAGEYSLNRNEDMFKFNITPTKGWQPFPGKLWLKTYDWTSELQIQDIKDVKITSNWRRTKG